MADRVRKPEWLKINIGANERYTCLLYTSDAADD